MNLQNKYTKFIEECSRNLIDLTNRNKLIHFNFNTKTLVRHFIEVAINDNHDSNSILEIASYKPIRHKDEKDNQVINEEMDSSNEIFESKEYKSDILYKRFKKNYNKQEEIKKEKGFNSTFFVYGFFKYKDNTIERHAPIFLINCDIQLVNKTYYKCLIEDEFENCVFNYAIEEYFKQEFGVHIPTEITSNIDNFECIKDRILKLKEFLREQKLDHESDAIANITIEDRFVISSYFDSTKQSLYLEMQQHSDKIIAHPMVEFLLSDINENESLNQEEYGSFERAESIDKNYKSDYFCNTFDCDGSQLEVIKAAKDGKSFIIQGPPGTGKTQTISNIIAELVSSGKKVLFVAEKKAAIDAVLRKFNEIGLEKIFLDLHNKNISSKNIIEQINASYAFFLDYFAKSKTKFDFTRLSELRDNIINRSDTLHKPLPIGKTTFDLIKSICEFERYNIPVVDCEIKIGTKDEYDAVLSLLRKTKEHNECYSDLQNPWLNINFNVSSINFEDSELIKATLCAIERLYSDNNKIKQKGINILADIKNIEVQLSEYQFKTDTCEHTIALMNSLRQYLQTANDTNNPWLSVEFIRDLKNVDDLKDIDSLISNSLSYLKDLEVISNNLIAINLSSWIHKIVKLLKSKELKKEAIKQIANIEAFNRDISSYFNLGIQLQFDDKQLAILRDNIIKIRQELEAKYSHIQTIIDVISYKALLRKLEKFSLTSCWIKIKGDEDEVLKVINCIQNHYTLKQDLQNLQEAERQNNIMIETNFEILQKFFNTASLKDDINNNNVLHLELLIKMTDSIIQTCDYLDIVKKLENAGAGLFWDQIIKGKISKNDIENTFTKTLYSQILDKTLKQNYKLKNTDSIRDNVSEFRILDKSSIKANIDNFKHNFASKICDKIHQELKIVKLLNRKRFPKPRKLISDYRNEIISIAGCVVCSPLTICQYFDIEDTTTTIFDTVIFDEASQIYTWDAVSSIIRAKQLIVAGDREQMPPSNYFTSFSYLEDEEDDNIAEERVGDYESLLDFLNTKLKSLPLVWHYRSKYEQLIAPSNKNVYENRLITFPSSNKSGNPMELCHVENAIWDKGKNEIEARQVLKKLKQLYEDGKRSVGVIAINYKQSELIQEIIETDEDLSKWYLEDDNDGLFIKNLENCQGDERDVIVISLTFASNKDKKLSGTTFRQINGNDSYKKLNVMFTRAREKVYLFSSINSHDIPDNGSKAYSFLREYVKCCETGSIDTLKQNREYDNFDSGFEENVCHLLRSEGFEVHTQVGCSGYRIDLAILCPINKDRYVIGIECDGEHYHKGRTAREKDRLREEVLENKGWKIHRIWSYDWLADKNLEVQKIKALTASNFA